MYETGTALPIITWQQKGLTMGLKISPQQAEKQKQIQLLPCHQRTVCPTMHYIVFFFPAPITSQFAVSVTTIRKR
jgi:hypothetical protein